jgi:hypothetical protein
LLQRIKFALAGWLGALIIRALMLTVRVRMLEPSQKVPSPVIYAFWHDQMLIPCYTHRGRGIAILISRHRDGEYIDRVTRHFGYRSVRGSTTRGAASSMMAILDELAAGTDVAFTPDGPRGPRHVLQPGVIYAAEKSGRPIQPAGIAAQTSWRLNSWDRFIIPKPFTTAVVKLGQPISVPPDLTDEQREQWRLKLETTLLDLTDQAEREAHLSP